MLFLVVAISAVAAIAAEGDITKEVVFQSGRELLDNAGNLGVYASEFETSINKLWFGSWNENNGVTYFYGYQPTWPICEADSDTKFRTLLRFDDLHNFISASFSSSQKSNVTVLESDVTMTFVNTQQEAKLEACFVTLPWDYDYEDNVRPKYLGTGWKYSRYNASGKHSVNWTEPGGWADCDDRVKMSFTVPGDGGWHNVSKTFNLDPGLVSELWLQNKGKANFGLLLRATSGSVNLYSSESDTVFVGQKPALRVKYSEEHTTNTPAVVSNYPVHLPDAPKVIWVDAAFGQDNFGSGAELYPFASPTKALEEAWPGDTIMMRSGVYAGSLYMRRSGVTLQSAPGHWAVVASSMHDPTSSVNAITVSAGVSDLVLKGFEIKGGFYYGVMLATSSSSSSSATNNVLLENMHIHHTGKSCVTLANGAAFVTVKDSEISNCGVRDVSSAHAIVGYRTSNLTVQDCYIHDLPGGAGVHLEAGAVGSVIKRNYFSNMTFGLNVGFAAAYSAMDPVANPNLYESLYSTVEGNIITGTRYAGINLWAAFDARIAFNTLFNVQEDAQSAIVVNSYSHAGPPTESSPTGPTKSKKIQIVGNIVTKSGTAIGGVESGFGSAMLHIREAGMAQGEMPEMGFNLYYAESPTLSKTAFATFHDERDMTAPFFAGLAGWVEHCNCDQGSWDANPLLQADFSLLSCSPAASLGDAAASSGGFSATSTAVVDTDFHGQVRANDDGSVGAMSLAAATTTTPRNKSMPPVPAAFAAFPAFTGVGAREHQYEFSNWPFLYWQNRKCVDLVVDAVDGLDIQEYNMDSLYNHTFKTAQHAHTCFNPCDRILLKGGQTHAGPLYLGRTNLTLMTDPLDLAAGLGRATLLCEGLTTDNCIHVGGDVGGKQAVELTLSNFNIKMSYEGGDCLRLNGGFGGGSLSFWDFYVSNSATGNHSRGHTLIEEMRMVGCGRHGVKLSTFVTDVVMRDLSIKYVGGSGISIYGGGNLTVAGCKIKKVVNGITLSGGVRSILLERNTITQFRSRGILVGNRGSSVLYSDVDYATSPNGTWHDAINCTVRNNVMVDGGGPGIAFYSAKDVFVGHNTIADVGKLIQGGVMLNLSPRPISEHLETLPANENVVFKSNVVSVSQRTDKVFKFNPIVNMRIVQGSVVATPVTTPIVPSGYDSSSCSAATEENDASAVPMSAAAGRELMSVHAMASSSSVTSFAAATWTGRSSDGEDDFTDGKEPEEETGGEDNGLQLFASSKTSSASGAATAATFSFHSEHRRRRRLLTRSQSFAVAAVNAPGTQGRNLDGSCPNFPDSNLLNMRVEDLPVHPRSEIIKIMVGATNMHAEFGVSAPINGISVPYGIPFVTVNSDPPVGSSEPPQPFMPIDISPLTGYPSESDWPFEAPLPDDTPVQNAYLNCPDPPCWGDRHSIVIDNSTCTVYETFRTFSPNITGGNWSAVGLAKFNMRDNLLRPLGWTSADAAGFPVYSGLVKFDDVIHKGVITHALRMTGPNSREAYSLPATHFAPAGDTGSDSPWMGMRVRLNNTFNCSKLARASRVFCVALQEYGGIFADNGPSWDFTGEATEAWLPYTDELKDIAKISPNDMEVLDSGCLCLDAKCVVADCGPDGIMDPTIPPVYPPIDDKAELHFDDNAYYQTDDRGKFKDGRRGSTGPGYKGKLSGWQEHLDTDISSVFANLKFDTSNDAALGALQATSPAIGKALPLEFVKDDFYGNPILPDSNGRVNAGALL